MEASSPASTPTSWDLDSDEIASVTSEDLRAHRPNRWPGAASSWRAQTEEERLLWRSMQQLEGRDLAVHLYDAFALNKARRPAAGQTVGDDEAWRPPKLWTAWPLRESVVPRSCLVPSRDPDPDERFTFRRRRRGRR
ncbi:hypothetical protein CDD83_2691 [Cordyceps sp. RAO-2017]|nr:hypothetical protein CDD83_2691 [Cordyceps sp. RAO-2017]